MSKPVKELKIVSGGRGINTHIYIDGEEQENISWLVFKALDPGGPVECHLETFQVLDQGEGEKKIVTWLAFEGVSYEETINSSKERV